MLQQSGVGFGAIALNWMMQQEAAAAVAKQGVHHTPRAKSVIWLFMVGGTSHMETFDPKPELNKYAGVKISETPYKETLKRKFLEENLRVVVPNDANGHIWPNVYPLQVGFRKRGESGIEVSDWWPHLSECIDDVAVVRSM